MDDKSSLLRSSITLPTIDCGCTYAQHAGLANQLNLAIFDGTFSVALSISLDIAQVTDMTVGVSGAAMLLAEGVEVRAGGGAAVGIVAELVDMHAALGVGVMAGDVVGDGGGRGLGGLLEGHLPGDLGVAADDGNWGGISIEEVGGKIEGRKIKSGKRLDYECRERWRSSRMQC